MSKRTTAALAAAAGAIALAPLAQAQPYGYYGQPNYAYDPCSRDATGRGVAGAMVGGGIGAVIGSQAAANHHRTDGSLLGGALGAIAGAVIGNKSAACAPGQVVAPPPPPPAPLPPQSYNAPYYPQDRYSYGYGRGGYMGRDGWRHEPHEYAYGRDGERYPLARGQSEDAAGCTLAESPIYMPDGRTQTRFVRVCRDRSGRYQVVD